MLTIDDYIKYVYNAPIGGTPWLIVFTTTPYGNPRPDHKTSLIMLKRVMCAKMVYGKNINVGIVDSIKTEFIRESFDFDVRRLGDKAT